MTNPALPHGLDRTLLLPALLMLGKKREEKLFPLQVS
jgi:hypothetical protein